MMFLWLLVGYLGIGLALWAWMTYRAWRFARRCPYDEWDRHYLYWALVWAVPVAMFWTMVIPVLTLGDETVGESWYARLDDDVRQKAKE